MADFDFSRDTNGNYQASVGNSGTRVTIQAFAYKIYVDIRDYFAKDLLSYQAWCHFDQG